MEDEHVVGMLVAALFGGQHTSNITSTWLLMMLHSPDAKKINLLPRLLQEQKAALSKTDGKLTYEALCEMSLLRNCIKETLRMFPPLIILMRKALRDIPHGDGLIIPKGDTVCIAPIVQNRLPDIFEEPDRFNPDRFESDEVTFESHRLADKQNGWIPFGGGRHACVGRYFAFLQISSIVSIFIRHYDMEWRDPDWEPKADFSQVVATPPPTGSWVKYKRKTEPLYNQLF